MGRRNERKEIIKRKKIHISHKFKGKIIGLVPLTLRVTEWTNGIQLLHITILHCRGDTDPKHILFLLFSWLVSFSYLRPYVLLSTLFLLFCSYIMLQLHSYRNRIVSSPPVSGSLPFAVSPDIQFLFALRRLVSFRTSHSSSFSPLRCFWRSDYLFLMWWTYAFTFLRSAGCPLAGHWNFEENSIIIRFAFCSGLHLFSSPASQPLSEIIRI